MIELLWLASLVGAALFFVGGLLLGRGTRPPVIVAAPPLEVAPPGPDPKVMALGRELAAVRAEHARERVTIEQATHDLSAARAQIERLRIDLMRSQKQGSDLQAEHKAASSELGDARGQLARLREELSSAKAVARPLPRTPLTVRAAGQKAGDVLQDLVDRVSRAAGVRCAVVADDLGLVVASQGELSEEVAAVGALFGRAGLQAQSVLPLHKVQRVTVEDDRNVTLTLRPVQTDEGDSGELALITLATGAAEQRSTTGEISRAVRPTRQQHERGT
jgi:predicted regulator of Ras-like GTPase activity (Roadblock/LC7/MglB family)